MGALDGKVAIVVGGASGIGAAHARLFAKEGARVIVADPGVLPDGSGADATRVAEVVREIVAEGGDAHALAESAATEAGADVIVTFAKQKYERVDAIVCCAGIRLDRSLAKAGAADLQAVLDAQLFSAFHMTKLGARAMLEHGDGGKIVLVTSAAGFLGNKEQASFAAASAGVYALVRTAAIELQRHKIFVNALCPVAKTRLTESLPMFEHVDTLTPEHVAPAGLFLASRLSGEKTGLVLGVSGAQLYTFKLVQTAGKFKDQNLPWTAEEIAEHWESISKA
jgi:NAD(P)-dependent dehydrogenase (short-subunit alcohol dehydrogenase family)